MGYPSGDGDAPTREKNFYAKSTIANGQRALSGVAATIMGRVRGFAETREIERVCVGTGGKSNRNPAESSFCSRLAPRVKRREFEHYKFGFVTRE